MITANIPLYYDPEHPYIRILNVSDMHIGAAEFARRDFRETLSENMADPNTYLITNGDGMDCITVRDKRFTIGGIAREYLNERPDEIVDHQVEDLTAELEPYKGRILGLGMGNHELKTVTELSTNAHARVCKNLGVRDLGYSCMLTLTLKPKGNGGRVRTFKIMQHHGWGGATRTEGGGLTGYAQAANYFDFDAAFFGHKHDFVYKRIPRMGTKNKGMDQHAKNLIIALTGSFLKTFNNTAMPSYAEVGGYRPTVLQGGWVLKLIPLHDGGIRTKVAEA
jgi:predicted phosphodiesterase